MKHTGTKDGARAQGDPGDRAATIDKVDGLYKIVLLAQSTKDSEKEWDELKLEKLDDRVAAAKLVFDWLDGK